MRYNWKPSEVEMYDVAEKPELAEIQIRLSGICMDNTNQRLCEAMENEGPILAGVREACQAIDLLVHKTLKPREYHEVTQDSLAILRARHKLEVNWSQVAPLIKGRCKIYYTLEDLVLDTDGHARRLENAIHDLQTEVFKNESRGERRRL